MNSRDYYIDYLRLLVIVSIVILHSAVTYSGFGNWHFIDESPIDDLSKLVSALFICFTYSYSMSFLFLIAAYYAANSYSRKGKMNFINGRIYRLGLPVGLFSFFIYPLTMYFLYVAGEKEALNFKEYLLSGHFLSGTGPLWFALALLIFSLFYAAIGRKQNVTAKNLPGIKVTIIAILLVGTASFLLRLIFPMGVEILNMPISNFAYYIALFVVGIKAYQYDWFNQIEYNYAKKWLGSTFVIGIVGWFAIMLFSGVFEQSEAVLSGGFNWPSYSYSVWESFLIFGMSIGLLGTFKRKINKTNKLMVILSKNSFSVYVWHTPILVGVSLMLRDITIYPLLKIAIVALTTLSFSFFLSHYVFRKAPLVKEIM
ncbi:surface polysaccharide O-acyltransferase-like enzyme [Methanohalophilus levihalophilus]|uniref:acyltransferase family protein n=1 Tax=Methanohalophilus levihalophilus TaxID=1431282 RepID=UPI001AE9EC84|nr:acyltransferase [Methanohalophilus levihalophilus]MBP2031177.1 surface polysaccharide O-acyltransferase-like enzyme [Methanohalophilus levihalophilus]